MSKHLVSLFDKFLIKIHPIAVLDKNWYNEDATKTEVI